MQTKRSQHFKGAMCQAKAELMLCVTFNVVPSETRSDERDPMKSFPFVT